MQCKTNNKNNNNETFFSQGYETYETSFLTSITY